MKKCMGSQQAVAAAAAINVTTVMNTPSMGIHTE